MKLSINRNTAIYYLKKIMPRFLKKEIYSFFRYRKNPALKSAVSKNKRFRNKYAGKRCFIIGNGPSINSLDFQCLEHEYTFTVNQMSRNNNFRQLHTNFHIWSDERFFDLEQGNPEDEEIISTMKNVNTEGNRPIVFYKYAAASMVEKFNLAKELNIHYYSDIPIDKPYAMKKFVDFTKLVPHFATVIQYAICLAVYMGFSEIYLLGCDCTGFMTIAQSKLNHAERSAYGYEISRNEKRRLEKMYQKTSLRDELEWYVDLIDTYKLMYQYCSKYGVRLYNATKGGLLENIPRVDFNDILAMKGFKDG